MKKVKAICTLTICLCFKLVLCQQSIDSYVLDSSKNVFTIVASSSNSLSTPIDLDFYPDQSARPFQLWILNQGTNSTGGSSVIVSNANKSTRTSQYIKDGNAYHFMAMASAMAFGESNWATAQDILDANRNGGKYTGPTLWSGDLSIYGVIGNPVTAQYNGSHLDMVHQTPYGKGIAFESDNIYWVMDGYDGTIKRYDFDADHTPGKSDHSDGRVMVYSEFKFTRDNALPAHIVIDKAKKYLYGCDPVGKRIFSIDITTGTDNGPITKVNNEPMAEYNEYLGIKQKDVVVNGLSKPVGIDIYGDRLIVTDNGSDEIIIYSISNNFAEVGRIKLKYASNPDPMGVKVGPDGKIYFADKYNKRVYMIDNSNAWPLAVNTINETKSEVTVFPNPSNTGSINIAGFDNLKSYSIYNICGAEIKSNTDATNNIINTEGLSQGMYILKLNNSIETKTIKINIF